jgi:phage FluMu gp28-like protein
MSALPVSVEDWVRLRQDAMMSLPDVSGGAAGVLLGYQRTLLDTVSRNALTVYEKSRRIGATWGIGALGVLTSGARRSDGGMDTLYIGYNLDMAREFVGVCGMWARALGMAAGEIGEFLFTDQDKHGAERSIAAFRIQFASGFEIVALASRPRSLRGRQGFVIIDEAAFHDDLAELLKAALALLIWGGRVLVISTHDGAENPFNELIQDIRAGRKRGEVMRTTFDDALQDGLYQRICLVRGMTWSPEAEAAWRDEIRGFYGDGAGEELDVIPRAGSGKFLPLHLIEARADRAIPVLRWRCDDAFVHLAEHARQREALAWCAENLAPLLARLDPREGEPGHGVVHRKALGGDIARRRDLSVFWPLVVMPNLVRRTPFVVELRNVPFEQQRQILFYVLHRLTWLSGVALDATGLGAHLAELTMQAFGAHRVEAILLSEPWYREQMPKLKAAFEDAMLTIPADAAVVGDFRSIEVVRGVARVPEKRDTAKGEDKDKAGGQRHGDAAIAAALAIYAAGRDVGDLDHLALPRVDHVEPLADFLGLGVRGAGLPTGVGDYLG